MTAGLDFGPIRDDDELLDRLGSRQPWRPACGEDDSLAEMLAAWTVEIDDDEREQAADVGPLGLRRVPGLPDAAPRVKVVQVRRARAVAVLGALALTISGGGVAAALTNTEILPMTRAITKAADIAGIVRREAPSPTQNPSAVSAAAMPQVVQSIQQAVDTGDYSRAQGMIDVLRRVLPSDPSSPQITQQVEDLAKQIDAAAPTTGYAPPVQKEATATTAPPKGDGAPVQATTAPPVTTGAPTSASSPSTPTADRTTDKSTEKPTAPTTKPSTPATPEPVPTAPPSSIGGAGGGQSAGTGTAPAERPSHGGGENVDRPGAGSTGGAGDAGRATPPATGGSPSSAARTSAAAEDGSEAASGPEGADD